MASFDRLLDGTTWMRALIAFVFFAGPLMAGNRFENSESGTDLPDEVYGVLAMVLAAFALDGGNRTAGLTGGAVAVLIKLAERFDVIQPVTLQMVN